MVGKHKAPPVRLAAENVAWVRAEAERRGVPMSTVLNEAVQAKIVAALDDAEQFDGVAEAQKNVSEWQREEGAR